MIEDVWLKRVIRYLILHDYVDDIEESSYPFNIQGIANSKKINPFHSVVDDKIS